MARLDETEKAVPARKGRVVSKNSDIGGDIPRDRRQKGGKVNNGIKHFSATWA